MCNANQEPDWKEVLVDIILKIITLGLYSIMIGSWNDEENTAWLVVGGTPATTTSV